MVEVDLEEGGHVRFIPSNIDELKKNKVTGLETLTGILLWARTLFFGP
jgi:hypothetical protein